MTDFTKCKVNRSGRAKRGRPACFRLLKQTHLSGEASGGGKPGQTGVHPNGDLSDFQGETRTVTSELLDSGRFLLHTNVVRVLIIDDDTELCALLQEFLEREGLRVTVEHDGIQGLELASSDAFDLIVLDLMLPGLDGFGLLKRLRTKSRIPVLVLTARGEDEDRIVGLDLGADDYLAKPFNPRELLARVRAILRRVQVRSKGKIEVNGVTIDPGTREVFCDQRPVEMTTLEFDILETLVRSAGSVVSRDALMETMYNRKSTPFDRSIDMHVSHLRRKLETNRTLIKTVRGIGYQFCSSGEEEHAAEEAAPLSPSQ